MTPEELAEAKDIAHGLFAITDSIVEHYEAKAIKMYPKLLEHIDSQAREIERLRIELSDLRQLHGQKSIDMMQQAAVIREQAAEIKHANHRYADLQNVCDDQDKEIKRQAAYVARLEAAYLQAYAASMTLDLFDPSWKTPEDKAREALERIKKGEQE